MQPLELFVSNLTEAFKMLGRDRIEVMEILTELSGRIDGLGTGTSGGAVILDGEPATDKVWSSALVAQNFTSFAGMLNTQISSVNSRINDQRDATEQIIGDLGEINVAPHGTVVEAINSVVADTKRWEQPFYTLAEALGDPSTLATTDKSTFVSAINEVLNTVRRIPVSPFIMEYESAELDVSPGTYYEIELELGTIPRLVSLTLKCKVADSFNYEVGEEISLDQVYTGIAYGTDVGIQSATSATKIRIKVAGAGAAITNMTSGAPAIIDPNNYKLIVRAYA